MKRQVKSGKIRINIEDVEDVNKIKKVEKVTDKENNIGSKKMVKSSKIRIDNKNFTSMEEEFVKSKVTSAKIRETKADKEIEQSDNISILMMVVVIIICFIVGIALGYVLYNISISSSNTAFIVNQILLKL